MIPDRVEVKRHLSSMNDRQLQNKLLAADDIFQQKQTTLFASLVSSKTNIPTTTTTTARDFKCCEVTGWCPDEKLVFRKPDNESLVSKPKASAYSFLTRDRSKKDITENASANFCFYHYPDSSRYIEQYRREHTCTDTTNPASVRNEFLELSKFYTYRPQTCLYQVPSPVVFAQNFQLSGAKQKDAPAAAQKVADNNIRSASRYRISTGLNIQSETELSRDTGHTEPGEWTKMPVNAAVAGNKISTSKAVPAKIVALAASTSTGSVMTPSLNRLLSYTKVKKASSPKVSSLATWEGAVPSAARTLDTLTSVAAAGDKDKAEPAVPIDITVQTEEDQKQDETTILHVQGSLQACINEDSLVTSAREFRDKGARQYLAENRPCSMPDFPSNVRYSFRYMMLRQQLFAATPRNFRLSKPTCRQEQGTFSPQNGVAQNPAQRCTSSSANTCSVAVVDKDNPTSSGTSREDRRATIVLAPTRCTLNKLPQRPVCTFSPNASNDEIVPRSATDGAVNTPVDNYLPAGRISPGVQTEKCNIDECNMIATTEDANDKRGPVDDGGENGGSVMSCYLNDEEKVDKFEKTTDLDVSNENVNTEQVDQCQSKCRSSVSDDERLQQRLEKLQILQRLAEQSDSSGGSDDLGNEILSLPQTECWPENINSAREGNFIVVHRAVQKQSLRKPPGQRREVNAEKMFGEEQFIKLTCDFGKAHSSVLKTRKHSESNACCEYNSKPSSSKMAENEIYYLSLEQSKEKKSSQTSNKSDTGTLAIRFDGNRSVCEMLRKRYGLKYSTKGGEFRNKKGTIHKVRSRHFNSFGNTFHNTAGKNLKNNGIILSLSEHSDLWSQSSYIKKLEHKYQRKGKDSIINCCSEDALFNHREMTFERTLSKSTILDQGCLKRSFQIDCQNSMKMLEKLKALEPSLQLVDTIRITGQKVKLENSPPVNTSTDPVKSLKAFGDIDLDVTVQKDAELHSSTEINYMRNWSEPNMSQPCLALYCLADPASSVSVTPSNPITEPGIYTNTTSETGSVVWKDNLNTKHDTGECWLLKASKCENVPQMVPAASNTNPHGTELSEALHTLNVLDTNDLENHTTLFKPEINSDTKQPKGNKLGIHTEDDIHDLGKSAEVSANKTKLENHQNSRRCKRSIFHTVVPRAKVQIPQTYCGSSETNIESARSLCRTNKNKSQNSNCKLLESQQKTLGDNKLQLKSRKESKLNCTVENSRVCIASEELRQPIIRENTRLEGDNPKVAQIPSKQKTSSLKIRLKTCNLNGELLISSNCQRKRSLDCTSEKSPMATNGCKPSYRIKSRDTLEEVSRNSLLDTESNKATCSLGTSKLEKANKQQKCPSSAEFNSRLASTTKSKTNKTQTVSAFRQRNNETSLVCANNKTTSKQFAKNLKNNNDVLPMVEDEGSTPQMNFQQSTQPHILVKTDGMKIQKDTSQSKLQKSTSQQEASRVQRRFMPPVRPKSSSNIRTVFDISKKQTSLKTQKTKTYKRPVISWEEFISKSNVAYRPEQQLLIKSLASEQVDANLDVSEPPEQKLLTDNSKIHSNNKIARKTQTFKSRVMVSSQLNADESIVRHPSVELPLEQESLPGLYRSGRDSDILTKPRVPESKLQTTKTEIDLTLGELLKISENLSVKSDLSCDARSKKESVKLSVSSRPGSARSQLSVRQSKSARSQASKTDSPGTDFIRTQNNSCQVQDSSRKKATGLLSQSLSKKKINNLMRQAILRHRPSNRSCTVLDERDCQDTGLHRDSCGLPNDNSNRVDQGLCVSWGVTKRAYKSISQSVSMNITNNSDKPEKDRYCESPVLSKIRVQGCHRQVSDVTKERLPPQTSPVTVYKSQYDANAPLNPSSYPTVKLVSMHESWMDGKNSGDTFASVSFNRCAVVEFNASRNTISSENLGPQSSPSLTESLSTDVFHRKHLIRLLSLAPMSSPWEQRSSANNTQQTSTMSQDRGSKSLHSLLKLKKDTVSGPAIDEGKRSTNIKTPVKGRMSCSDQSHGRHYTISFLHGQTSVSTSSICLPK